MFCCKRIFVLVFAVCLQVLVGQDSLLPVKYVFLFIGDGMSYPQRQITEEYLQATQQRGLLINSLPCRVGSTTYSANAAITDSAASGTAIACGLKTNNGILGQDPAGNRLESIAETAKKNGRKVAIITSVTLNHATPAAFYGHRKSRSLYYELGVDLVHSGFDFFGGGDIAHADKVPSSISPEENVGNLLEYAQTKGYKVFFGRDLLKCQPADGKVIAVGRKGGTLPLTMEWSEEVPTLAEITRKGIEMIDNEAGFFMMVEGGMIDWACHSNDLGSTLQETIAFDDAVKVAYEFYQKHPGDTLIVVTGDHETGGLTLGVQGETYHSKISNVAAQKTSCTVFNACFSNLKKTNPKAAFADIKPFLTASFGFQFTDAEEGGAVIRLTAAEQQKLECSFYRAMGNNETLGKCFANPADGKEFAKTDPGFLRLANLLLSEKANVFWMTTGHTALPVCTSAVGRYAEEFTTPDPAVVAANQPFQQPGLAIPAAANDNTDIAKRLRAIMGKIPR